MIDLIKEGLKKDGSSYLVLVLSIILSAIWGSFKLLSDDIAKNEGRVNILEQQTHQLDKSSNLMEFRVKQLEKGE